MPVAAATPEQLRALEALIERWATGEEASNPLVAAVDRDPALRRWYVRLRGEEKSTSTIWLTLRERTLHYESYFMPAPEENVKACYEYLLRANRDLYGLRFAIGDEEAVFLVGQMPLSAVDEGELDRVAGCVYEYTERYFPTALAIGYASRVAARRNQGGEARGPR